MTTSRTEGAGVTPKAETPEQKAQQEKRTAERERYRAFYEKRYGERMVWRRNDRVIDPEIDMETGKPKTEEQKASEMEVVAGSAALPPATRKLQDGYYDVTYIPDYVSPLTRLRNFTRQTKLPGVAQDEFDQDVQISEQLGKMAPLIGWGMGVYRNIRYAEPKLLLVQVKDGVISPVVHPHYTNRNAFQNTWTQVFRMYAAGTGTKELSLDFPNASKNPELIDLGNVERLMAIAKKEGVAMGFGETLERALAIKAQKGGRHAIRVQKIRNMQRETVQAMKDNPELRKIDAQLNVEGLNTDVDGLTKATASLKDAKADELPAKVKEAEAQLQKVNGRLDKIQSDVKTLGAEPESCAGYDIAIAQAEAAIQKAKAAIPDQDACNALKSGVQALADKAGAVRVVAGQNKMPVEERAKVKLDELKGKLAAINKDLKHEDLIQALKAVDKTLGDIQSEPNKLDMKDRVDLLEKYQAAMVAAKEQLIVIKKDLKHADQEKADAVNGEFTQINGKIEAIENSATKLTAPEMERRDFEARLTEMAEAETIAERITHVDYLVQDISDKVPELESVEKLELLEQRQARTGEAVLALEKLKLEKPDQVRVDELKRNLEATDKLIALKRESLNKELESKNTHIPKLR